MVSASIFEAVKKLEAGTVKKRTEGLDDLRRILTQPQASQKLHEIHDEGWHKILDVLFGLVSSDKHDLLGGSATAKTRALSRLPAVAQALRTVINSCSNVIRRKTAYAVLDHIAGHLKFDNENEEPFREAVQSEYIKTFCIVLSNGSHGEHLRTSQWQKHVDFILEAIDANLANLSDVDEDNDDAVSVSRVISTNGSVRGTVPFRTSQNSGSKGPRSLAAQIMDDLVVCLRNLSSITNSPLRSRLGHIAQTILRTLSTALQTKDVAFECLNNILIVARTEEVALVSHVTAQVLVLIRQLWSNKADPKSISLREQMLATLILVRQSLVAGLVVHSKIDQSAIESLADYMLDEYDHRTDQYRLQISDLELSKSSGDNFFSRGGIAPHLGSEMATLNWTTVSIIASLRTLSQQFKLTRNDEEDPQRPNKRPRISLSFPDLTRLLFIDESDIRLEDGIQFMEDMLPTISDDRRGTSSWILLVISRLSRTFLRDAPELKRHWFQAWTAASHLVSSNLNSRTACFAMMALVDANIMNDELSSSVMIESCFRSGSRGPPGLIDSALLLFTTCLLSNLLHTERYFKDFRDRVLSWLDGVWSLPTVRDYAHFVEVARNGQTVPLYELCMSLMGTKPSTRSRSWTIHHNTIYHVWARMSESARFTDFVFGAPKSTSSHHTQQHHDSLLGKQTAGILDPAESVVPRFLLKKLESLRHTFHEIEYSDSTDKTGKQLTMKRRANLSIDMAEIICSACTVTALISDLNETDEGVTAAWQCVLDYMKLQLDEDAATFETTCFQIVRRLLAFQPIPEDERFNFARQTSTLVRSLRDIMAGRVEMQASENEIDFDFATQSATSQQSQGKAQKKSNHGLVRRDLSYSLDNRSSFIRMEMSLLLESHLTEPLEMSRLGTEMVNYVAALSAQDLLASSKMLLEWLDRDKSYTAVDTARLLRHVAEVCLQADENERNEAALCFCLKVLNSTIGMWISTEDEELGDLAFDCYSWFVNIALGKGIASMKVLHHLAKLLEALLQHQPRYGAETLASPRTSLLQILKVATSGLRFEIVPALTTLFDRYVLTEHAAIFDDIVDCLPTDPEDEEGIIVRLYILAKLGSQWRTVLRQAVYHVFETAANVPAVNSIAYKALQMMSKEVGLGNDPTKLLHLFAPQIFFTWLEGGAIDTIPFAAFGYESLRHLVLSEKDELVAQVVLRSNLRHQQALVNVLGFGWKELVQDHFPRSQVYAVATDVIENRAGAEAGPIERALCDQLGQDNYTLLTERYFPEAVAHTILSLSDDRGFEKMIGGSSRYKSLAHIYTTILQKGHSTVTYPSRQQPSFRAKYFMQILSKLCLVANTEPDSFWNPALLVFVYRTLLNDAEPALGPLHVASMIRKVRIAVTLAGPVALEGYPLEMLLYSLRTYITQFHCAEDTIGIYWYLLENSTSHLEKNLSFVTGLSVSIFASLSVFATSSQESTTQESQFLSTMSKAKEFRIWLGNFLQNLKAPKGDADRASRFREIIYHAKDITATGSSCKHEPEGNLLYHVLLDQAATEPLISSILFDVTMQVLSEGFRLSEDPSDDILGDDEDIVLCASVLHAALNRLRASAPFLTWAGVVMGKAYLIRGPKLELSTKTGEHLQEVENESSLNPINSYRTILRYLTNILWGEDVQAASTAEQTLSMILGSISKEDRESILEGKGLWSYLEDLVFDSMQCPKISSVKIRHDKLEKLYDVNSFENSQLWCASLANQLVSQNDTDQFLKGLTSMLQVQNTFGRSVLPAVIHIILHKQLESQIEGTKETLSKLFNLVLSIVLEQPSTIAESCARVVLEIIIYLRKCTIPNETSRASRNSWLDIEFSNAAAAALHCRMPNSALLMLETDQSQQALTTTRGRRSSMNSWSLDTELVSKIFQTVQDDDFFYGISREHNIASVMAKLKHEGHGSQILALQSSFLDASMRADGSEIALERDGDDIVTALSQANLHGLAFATQRYAMANEKGHSSARIDESLLNVHQWNISSSEHGTKDPGSLHSVLAEIATLESRADIKSSVHNSIRDTVFSLTHASLDISQNLSHLKNLAVMAEIERLITAKSNDSLDETWAQILSPMAWAQRERFESISSILMAREATAAAMNKNSKSKELFFSNPLDLLLHEIQTVRSSLGVASKHDAAQFRLNRAVYLHDLGARALRLNLDVDSVIVFDIANTLWSQGEITTPIEMLRSLQDSKGLGKGALPISKAELLTDLGQKLSQARLDRPDEVTRHYLQPAIEALQKKKTGSMAGRVFHNFAAFCDEQLRDSAAKDDFDRITKIRNRKMQEMNELEEMSKNSKSGNRKTVQSHYAKAKDWFRLDNEEYRRLKAYRKQLLEKALENYLLSMQACDDYAQDVLRLLSLWLGNAEVHEANTTVQQYLRAVPTLKLTPFVNQLSSRLLSNEDKFQEVLFDLLYEICIDHPYHSHYQLFAVCRSRGMESDSVATSRHKSASKLSKKVHASGGTSSAIWVSIHNTALNYVSFAQERPSKDVKTGSKIAVKSFKYGAKLEQTIQGLSHKIPPPTMSIVTRADKDYSSVPTLAYFDPQISIAGGMSAPKITTATATDGSRHKMLLKGGNDDLRQDAIMEQVFGQVSDLLKDHRPTQQRDLGIRTYKVIPLTHNSGIIEFVQNTIPLHEYLLPAHSRYFPKDFKSNACRKAISDATSRKPDERLKVYRYVTDHFHPVMRFFFMEHFLDPDKWFQKRLNYSRSTAAISMLGHVLGLGDRHGHNILLDQQTGEVVHIDLGVAFEAGRVLPIPEVIPFRLTRDLVDGMGISGVEGPFRRCCNFTLEALRKSQDAIMTILDVLRWDPLYSWSTSPLRVQRMQDQQEREAAAAAAAASSKDEKPTPTPDAEVAQDKENVKAKMDDNVTEPGEADRALAVVAKKLSASLSVEATVNELIREATDERNLSVLYCGWAAYV